MSKIEIYYFSGTGNSLHAARELQKRMSGVTLIPIAGALKEQTIRATAETVGLVYPVHAFTMPLIVEEFLKKADLSSASYIFALTTRFCAPRFVARIDRLLRRQGKSLDAFFSVRMPQNYLPVFDVETPAQIEESESRLQDTLDSMADSIFNKQKSMPEDAPLPVKIISNTVFPVISALDKATRYFHLEDKFCADDQCTGCGTCEKVCLSGKIKMRDERPVWDTDTGCTFCFACIHYCPARAIQISGKKTGERGRYHHPAVSVDDIAGQKQLGE